MNISHNNEAARETPDLRAKDSAWACSPQRTAPQSAIMATRLPIMTLLIAANGLLSLNGQCPSQAGPVCTQQVLQATTLSSTQIWWDQTGQGSSLAVPAPVGDVDGDGSGEWAVGHPDYNAVWLISGTTGHNVIGIIPGEAGSTGFGKRLTSGRDLNGDHVPDIVVADPDRSGSGKVYAYSGSTLSLLWQTTGPGQQGCNFGASIAIVDDVNGDGRSDVVIGAPDFDDGAMANVGQIWLLNGVSGVPLAPPLARAAPNNRFGRILDNAHDVNGDGVGDFIVSKCGQAGGWDVCSFDGISITTLFYEGNGVPLPNYTDNGWSVAGLGDVNGDGYSDIIVSEPNWNSGQGRVRLIEGAPGLNLTNYSAHVAMELYGATINEGIGAHVACLGDMNGDGLSDFIVMGGHYPSPHDYPPHNPIACTGASEINSTSHIFLGSPISSFPQVQTGSAMWVGVHPYCEWDRFMSDGDLNGDGRSGVFAFTKSGFCDYFYTRPAPHCSPVAPARVTATVAGCAMVRVSWAPLANPSGYCVMRNGAVIGTVGGNDRTFDDIAPVMGANTYSVRAFSADGFGATSAPATAIVTTSLCYQTNQPRCGLTIDGVLATATSPAIITRNLYSLISAQLMGQNADIGEATAIFVSNSPLRPAGGGGVVLVDGQIVNLDLAAPLSVYAIFPWPGDAAVSTLTMSPGVVSIQRLQFTPLHPSGFVLSQATQINTLATCTLPAAPTSLSAGQVAAYQLTLGWVDLASDEIAYRLERLDPGEDPNTPSLWDRIGGDLPAGTTSYVDSGVQPNSNYQYRVRCGNLCGDSPYSNTVVVTTACSTPIAPDTLTAYLVATDHVVLNWHNNAVNAAGIRVARLDPGEDPGNPSLWDNISGGSLPPNTTSFTASGLVAGSTYSFKLRCVSAFGCFSDYSNICTVTTCPTVVSAPANCTAARIGNTSAADPILVTWTYTGPPITGIRVARLPPGFDPSTAPASAWTGISGDLHPPPAQWEDHSTSLVDGQRFYYKVRAYVDSPCGRIYSDYSNIDSARP